ncbi:zinc finger MYM-type protein 1-like [Salvia hispanica]|uniref:zinc finger MYM-type protein 1-like n=1 Tax=Salvia hispanica TaxID=49212 RepID=UPI002009C3D4|nr:zinc finger MYM-type protein 1-like [Salvia hispanica]
MDKYLTKRPRVSSGSSSIRQESQDPDHIIDKDEIEADPGKRSSIANYDVNIRDRIRREYVAKGPCQPKGLDFKKTRQGKDNRCFRDVWYKDRDWLEYSVLNDAAYCFYCFLFKRDSVAPGDEAFTTGGFSNWKKALEKFNSHVGDKNSSHNKARIEYENFLNQRQSVTYVVRRGITTKEKEYRIRLTATVDFIRFLLSQGLPIRGHDESSTSLNQGNFHERLKWYGLRNDEVGKKDVVRACAVETTLEILRELEDRFFFIMVDESRDCSTKEQMAIVIRFVNEKGEIIERFLALVHVKETKSICLKEAIDSAFAKFELSLSKLRGQGYDGASNMRGKFNGLKALILKENSSACYLGLIVVLCGSSSKMADQLRQNEHDRLVQMLENKEIETDLLRCMACLNPKNDFAAFDVEKLAHLASLYTKDFSSNERTMLLEELELFVGVMRKDDRLIATASVEKIFSDMKIVKTDRRNWMGDEWLNDSLVIYSERSIFTTVSSERILTRFQNMDTRRSQSSRLADASAT